MFLWQAGYEGHSNEGVEYSLEGIWVEGRVLGFPLIFIPAALARKGGKTFVVELDQFVVELDQKCRGVRA